MRSLRDHIWWTITDGYDTESWSCQSSNNVHSWAGLAKLFTRNWESLIASALERIVSMTGYWNAYKLAIPMQSPIVMEMAMMSRQRKPPSMPPSQDEAHTMIGDFTEITVSNSDNDLHLVRVTSAKLNRRMPDIPEVEIWRTVSHWMFFLFSSLYFVDSLDLGPI